MLIDCVFLENVVVVVGGKRKLMVLDLEFISTQVRPDKLVRSY